MIQERKKKELAISQLTVHLASNEGTYPHYLSIESFLLYEFLPAADHAQYKEVLWTRGT